MILLLIPEVFFITIVLFRDSAVGGRGRADVGGGGVQGWRSLQLNSRATSTHFNNSKKL